MSFVIEPGESPADAVRRVAKSDLEHCLHAVACLEDDSESRVHGVRKRIKRLRSLLRLVRPRFPRRAYRNANTALRDAARLLATARESAVRRRALNTMLRLFPEVSQGFANAMREQVVGQSETELPSEHAVGQAELLLQQAQAIFADTELSAKGWNAVAPGLRMTYRSGKRLARRSLRRGRTESFHEWRKWVKYQWHQVELLSALWPDDLTLRAAALKRLADALGDEHDLADLRAHLLATPVDSRFAPDLEALLAQLDKRRAELRGDALRIGSRLFAESAAAFDKRMGAYYSAFQREDVALSLPGDR